ncbi:MAG: hypothetical protein V9G29_13935 [Burkholderiaceae bacterium]
MRPSPRAARLIGRNGGWQGVGFAIHFNDEQGTGFGYGFAGVIARQAQRFVVHELERAGRDWLGHDAGDCGGSGGNVGIGGAQACACPRPAASVSGWLR